MADEEKNAPQETLDEASFWQKLKQSALAAGSDTVEKALQLYYALLDSDTPVWAKTVIVGALLYFINIIDAIPDFAPAGYADDLGALAAAIAAVASAIKPEHKERAAEKLKSIFKESSN